MGDFDVKPAGPAHVEKKKIVFVAILAAILAGVLGFHFLSQTAQPAAAATDFNAVSETTADETPAQVRSALRDDPTAQLLLSTNRKDPALEALPHNPFIMSQAFRASLTRAPDAPAPHIEAFVPREPPKEGPKSVKVDDFRLSTVVRQGDRLSAIVNGTVVSVGSVIGNARVLEVRDDRVILQHVDSPNGPKATLMMERPGAHHAGE